MKYQITWTANTEKRGQLGDLEEIEGETANEAFNQIRTPIIAKLNDAGRFMIVTLNIRNVDGPTTLNLNEAYKVLNSLNAEGGLAKYEDPPSTFNITFNDKQQT